MREPRAEAGPSSRAEASDGRRGGSGRAGGRTDPGLESGTKGAPPADEGGRLGDAPGRGGGGAGASGPCLGSARETERGNCSVGRTYSGAAEGARDAGPAGPGAAAVAASKMCAGLRTPSGLAVTVGMMGTLRGSEGGREIARGACPNRSGGMLGLRARSTGANDTEGMRGGPSNRPGTGGSSGVAGDSEVLRGAGDLAGPTLILLSSSLQTFCWVARQRSETRPASAEN